MVRGPHVFAGYWNRPEETAASFVDGRWFRTGDVLRVDDDGWAHVVDRVKDMYISGGENVYPAEVEAVAVQLDAVANCAVVGVADARWGEVGVAYVQLREGATLTEAELRAHLEANLARYKVPKYLEFVPELPRNATGKIRRVELRHRAADEHPTANDRPRRRRGRRERHDQRRRATPADDQIQALLPPSLQVERHGDVAVLRLTRAAKRNALDDADRARDRGVLQPRRPPGSRPSCSTPRASTSAPAWTCPS